MLKASTSTQEPFHAHSSPALVHCSPERPDSSSKVARHELNKSLGWLLCCNKNDLSVTLKALQEIFGNHFPALMSMYIICLEFLLAQYTLTTHCIGPEFGQIGFGFTACIWNPVFVAVLLYFMVYILTYDCPTSFLPNKLYILVMKVHIIGADRLLAVVPNRDPRKTVSLAMVSPDGKLGDRTGSKKRQSGYNKWNIDESLSGKCSHLPCASTLLHCSWYGSEVRLFRTQV